MPFEYWCTGSRFDQWSDKATRFTGNLDQSAFGLWTIVVLLLSHCKLYTFVLSFVFSTKIAYSSTSGAYSIGDWCLFVCLSVCLSVCCQTFFKSLLLLRVFSDSHKTWHTCSVCQYWRKTVQLDFQNFASKIVFRIFQISNWVLGPVFPPPIKSTLIFNWVISNQLDNRRSTWFRFSTHFWSPISWSVEKPDLNV